MVHGQAGQGCGELETSPVAGTEMEWCATAEWEVLRRLK